LGDLKIKKTNNSTPRHHDTAIPRGIDIIDISDTSECFAVSQYRGIAVSKKIY